ncbi:carbohydrate ABC transporter permease [Klenkia taihuensis]|uniref:Carbohydrate ABC transporter membrane protein 2, CUT1 family (TC 3.A.1.1.-) n=1 Tax=Klenkia taihuensis TaxID=1225127 RepID=A0A1I1U3Q1_9ACTN|nr:carbohydrate ABC transporter permease [Klenkia taihuensis]GHE06949.1 ABC transporter permease [Klenkia taihuensis]SFD65427.1 carbohydrate ABC transporter membrane protein 2, CUT1 family (TC 3.A.1.1.-) [Klenkia taihuensis]
MRRPNYLAGLGSLIWLAVIAVPLYAVIATAFRPSSQYVDDGPLALPSQFTLDNFATVLAGNFPRYVGNTLFVAAATVVVVLVLAVPVAYSVVRGGGRSSSRIFRLFLLGLAIPAQAVIIPVFLIINRLGLYDTYWAVILPTAAFALPVSVLVLAGGMRDINAELFEAIELDGASPGRALWHLVIPLSRSSIATVAVFTALNAWNGFLFPLILTQSAETRMVTLGIYDYIGQYQVNPPQVFAAILLSAVPILAIYLFARRSLVAGLAGAGGK